MDVRMVALPEIESEKVTFSFMNDFTKTNTFFYGRISLWRMIPLNSSQSGVEMVFILKIGNMAPMNTTGTIIYITITAPGECI